MIYNEGVHCWISSWEDNLTCFACAHDSSHFCTCPLSVLHSSCNLPTSVVSPSPPPVWFCPLDRVPPVELDAEVVIGVLELGDPEADPIGSPSIWPRPICLRLDGAVLGWLINAAAAWYRRKDRKILNFTFVLQFHYTVKPVYSDRPRETQKVAFVDR